MKRTAVVGAGVIGLTTAIVLRRAGHEVTVVTKAITPSTTSDISAAMWWPFHAEPAEKVLRWCAQSFDEFVTLVDDPETGVVMRNGTFGFADSVPDWAVRVPGARRAEPQEVPLGCGSAVIVDAPMIEMNRYMPWLMGRLGELDIPVAVRNLRALDEVDEADVVVNCSGLGARELASDASVFAARGRVVRLEQVGVERFVGSEAGEWPTHVFPRRDDVVVGGTYEVGVDTADIDVELAAQIDDDIVARAIAMEPLLAGAERLSSVAGLRPGRPEVRLEAETTADGRTIVHNYGHGGGGVTLSWGCAHSVLPLLE